MAFSASILKAKTCSVVLLPDWYADWVRGILVLSLSKFLRSKQIARIFLSTDSNIMGLRCPGGPGFFSGFGRGIRIPSLTSVGNSPVSPMMLYISAIPSHMVSGPYFIGSLLSSSIPALFPVFSLFTAFSISVLAQTAYNKLKDAFESKKVSVK